VKGAYNSTVGALATQTFEVESSHTVSDRPFEIVRLRIRSNYGHPHYTCLYRFRVHGAALF
jgi:SUN domain-containing protein 1/2